MDTLSHLADSIAAHCPQPLPKSDALEAARNLAGLFEMLIEIDQQQKKGSDHANYGSADRLRQAP